MICRTCLRSRRPLRIDGLPAPRLLQAPQRRSISVASLNLQSTMPLFLLQVLPSNLPAAAARSRLFATSAPASSAAAQPQEPAPPSAGAPEKPTYLSEGESQVWDRLIAEFAPTELVVQDISGGCGSMYGIEVCSEKFRGLNMLKQQRLVNAALGDFLKEWHGVQLKTRVP
ncbi:bola-like protein [Parathielavia hyrcaniae]|uniref:Bola-like protein n=1 Tax=Parathielavia hyrcaniae TaxID=113614 RepID=A0AAN6PTR6_9PEZI|nr:bola-like protein [Parathielavia hyrcaniae]